MNQLEQSEFGKVFGQMKPESQAFLIEAQKKMKSVKYYNHQGKWILKEDTPFSKRIAYWTEWIKPVEEQPYNLPKDRVAVLIDYTGSIPTIMATTVENQGQVYLVDDKFKATHVLVSYLHGDDYYGKMSHALMSSSRHEGAAKYAIFRKLP